MTIKYSDRMISVLISNTNTKQELQELLDRVQSYCHPILRGVLKQKIKFAIKEEQRNNGDN